MNDKVKEINEGALEVAEAIIKKYDDGIITVNDIYCKTPHNQKNCFEIQDYIAVEFNETDRNTSKVVNTYTVSCYWLRNDVLDKDCLGNPIRPSIYKIDSMLLDRTTTPMFCTSFSLYINDHMEGVGPRAERVYNKVLGVAKEYLYKKYFLGEVHKKNENETMDTVYDRILTKIGTVKEAMGLND